MKKLLFTLFLFLCFCFVNLYSQDLYLIQGRILAEDTRDPLITASISVEGTRLSSVTNRDGFFTIRVPKSEINGHIVFKHLGFENKTVPINILIAKPTNQILMRLASTTLKEIEVIGGDGTLLVKEALSRIMVNYSDDPEMMVSFYREAIKKGSKYISLVEAVLDIYKTSYSSISDDQAKIYIGRKATDISVKDTILLKFQGGISNALLLDIAKNPEIIFGKTGEYYFYTIEGMEQINDKPNYVINFESKPGIEDLLFRGTIYLDKESLAFNRMEFNMNVEGRKDAPALFIRKKPMKMKVVVDHAAYYVDYLEQDGKWYLNHTATEVEFKVRWTNRLFGLFASTYTVTSEIAVTDKYSENIKKFPRDERISSTDVISEKVEFFKDPNFWGDYTIIEPDKEISNAIQRLSIKLLKRSE